MPIPKRPNHRVFLIELHLTRRNESDPDHKRVRGKKLRHRAHYGEHGGREAKGPFYGEGFGGPALQQRGRGELRVQTAGMSERMR